ncbi:MAG: hypothetical protein AB7K24_14015 [Gemmataceae bacterium]
MFTRYLMVTVLALGASSLTLQADRPVLSQEDQRVSHEGRVVTGTEVSLTIATREGEEMKFALTKETRIVIEEEPAQPELIKPGMQVRVTAYKAKPAQAMLVEVRQPR